MSHHVNLELVAGRLQFCIYHFHEWPDYTLFLIPIDFAEKLHGEIKKITLEFIRRFIKYHRIQDITDTPYFEMSECCIDYMDMDRLDDEEKRELYRKERLFRSYEKGTVHRKLERMHSRAFCRNLERHIRTIPIIIFKRQTTKRGGYSLRSILPNRFKYLFYLIKTQYLEYLLYLCFQETLRLT